MLNFDASNFLDLGVRVATTPAGVVTAAVDVDGLNRTGVLGASVVQGMRNLVDSAVGTRSQRIGLVPQAGEGRRISPWLRIYNGNGNVSPAGAGFGAGEPPVQPAKAFAISFCAAAGSTSPTMTSRIAAGP